MTMDKVMKKNFCEVDLGEESHGNRSLETSHGYSSNHGGCESCGNRSQETSLYNSSKRGGRGHTSSMTTNFDSCNLREYVDIGGSMSKGTSHYYHQNQGTRVDV